MVPVEGKRLEVLPPLRLRRDHSRILRDKRVMALRGGHTVLYLSLMRLSRLLTPDLFPPLKGSRFIVIV
jgi:hypothetical protein